MNITRDKDLYQQGLLYIKNGLKLCEMVESELDIVFYTQKTYNPEIGLCGYLMSQSIELLVKGICCQLGGEVEHNHVIKNAARELKTFVKNNYELNQILDDINDLCDNKFSYILKRWQSDGRYEPIVLEKIDVEQAILIMSKLKRFVKTFQLDIEKE